ncbi:bark storage protein A-like [Ricinus communis]|uniref:bark storage protein A-like n=1 Tax=Ricinus communis TaxID=3988 RepID=UPI00201A7584|nr:bark storage protein A-like [Ricinus communis]
MIQRWSSVGEQRRKYWTVDLEAVIVGLVVVLMIDYSEELKLKHPMHGVVDRVNENGGPYIGLVMAYPTEEVALQGSGFFVPSSHTPSVDLAGRRFHIGKISGIDVIYVMTGEQILNAGITVQILVDAFDIKGIVHYGTAGSANDSLSFGDVSVLNYVALTSSWKWKEFKSGRGQLPELKFGAFNFPEKGDNLLAKIEFTPTQVYSTGKTMEEMFWLPIDSNWFKIAFQLQDLNLQQCVNDTYCLPKMPKVVYGLRGSTADIFLANAAYREFLYKEFSVSTVDEESAAIVMTSLSNGVPCIVFRGVSDLAGGGGILSDTSLSFLASVNALNVAIEFIKLVGNVYAAQDH